MDKMNVALVFGGNSSEHDVSKRSAKNYYDGFNKEKYNVIPFLIDKQGHFINSDISTKVLFGEDEDQLLVDYVYDDDLFSPINELNKHKIDLFFPVVHGNLGEDGTLQGLFRMLDKPFVGADLKAHAMSFDKVITKEILTANGIRNTEYFVVRQNEKVPDWSEVVEKFGDVVFVKAANQGSSVGISRVTNEQEYKNAILDSFQYDEKLLVEKAVNGAFELEVGLIGNSDIQVSLIGAHSAPNQGEGDGWFDYSNKFVDNSKMQYDIPAKISGEQTEEIKQMAVKAMRALDIKGLVRMDFLIDSKGVVYLGEPNTLPGFTNMSLFQVLWDTSGVKRADLINRLVEYALEEYNRKKGISYSFQKLEEENL
ncbi:MAG: D-alanine--D-alanine ligase, partial [Lactobacillaceae bacterium]|nr:D-alanine--D-alanine ligase [Lactobacillaceae bacterium]